jgi:hypothetical protein
MPSPRRRMRSAAIRVTCSSIQNRTDAEVRLLADGALDPILHALCDAG